MKTIEINFQSNDLIYMPKLHLKILVQAKYNSVVWLKGSHGCLIFITSHMRTYKNVHFLVSSVNESELERRIANKLKANKKVDILGKRSHV